MEKSAPVSTKAVTCSPSIITLRSALTISSLLIFVGVKSFCRGSTGDFLSSCGRAATLPREVAAFSFPGKGWATLFPEGQQKYVDSVMMSEQGMESVTCGRNWAGDEEATRDRETTLLKVLENQGRHGEQCSRHWHGDRRTLAETGEAMCRGTNNSELYGRHHHS